jgi:hypothetical protein
VKRVTDAGTFRFKQRLLYIANALVNQHIGLEEPDDGVWVIYFNTVLIATLDSATSSSAGNPEVLPMSSDTSVTYLSGCSVR